MMTLTIGTSAGTFARVDKRAWRIYFQLKIFFIKIYDK